MRIRNIVKIDQNKCDGCGLCVPACAEGAIQIIDGKAQLVSEIYCDGLGACLGHCPRDAITIEKRKAANFDEQATEKHLEQLQQKFPSAGCPGMQMLERTAPRPAAKTDGDIPSQLSQWPVQLKLVSPAAPYFKNADLLLAADCVAFAMADFHQKLLRGRAVAVACPKLDDCRTYVQKIAEIITLNDLKSLTVVRMQVPCCAGLVRIAEQAVEQSGKRIEFEEIVIDLEGRILERRMHSVKSAYPNPTS